MHLVFEPFVCSAGTAHACPPLSGPAPGGPASVPVIPSPSPVGRVCSGAGARRRTLAAATERSAVHLWQGELVAFATLGDTHRDSSLPALAKAAQGRPPNAVAEAQPGIPPSSSSRWRHRQPSPAPRNVAPW